jgi:Leucine-rich repeat (LRR) protein
LEKKANHLTHLSLDKNVKKGDAYKTGLVPLLQKRKSLTHLSMQSTQIQDGFLLQLTSGMSQVDQLKYLNISRNNITSESI